VTEEPRIVLDRLRAITWDDDFSVSLAHARSRAVLMREYLRRAALWAQAYDATADWPFFDLARYVAPDFVLDPAISAEMEEYINRDVGTPSIQTVCRGAVRWAAVRADATAGLPDLPDMYEPLLLMFERGGGYAIGQFIDLQGVAIPQGNLEQNLSATPFLSLANSTLDALEGRGRITYYAKVDESCSRANPRGLARQRLVGSGNERYDEAFTRNLRWEPTEYFRLYELGHNEVDHVEISEAEAAAFIELMTEKLTGAR
jgi:hypothetical protein